MGYQDLTPDIDAGVGNLNAGLQSYGKETLSAPGNGDWFVYPRGAHSVTCICDFSGGSGSLEATNAPLSQVMADTVLPDAIVPWAQGTQSAKTDDRVFDITAVRMVNVSGTTIVNYRSNN